MAKGRGDVFAQGSWKQTKSSKVQAIATFAEDDPTRGKYDVIPLIQLKVESSDSTGKLWVWMTPAQARILSRQLEREAEAAENM